MSRCRRQGRKSVVCVAALTQPGGGRAQGVNETVVRRAVAPWVELGTVGFQGLALLWLSLRACKPLLRLG